MGVSTSNYYTILINDDHSFTHSKKQRIMYRSHNIDTIQFLVKPMYGNLDMTKVNAVLEYITPISRNYDIIVLKPSEELYKNRVEYLLPIDINLTKEVGQLEMTINFSYLSMDENGNFKEQVRQIGSTAIEIHKTPNWSDYITDTKLTNIAQIMLTNQAMVEELKVQAELLQTEKADGLGKDEETNEIYLTAQGIEIGNRVKDDDSCGDGEGIPVVVFGQSSPDNPDNPEEDNEVNNVVHF